jgi:hypothetical protein
MKKIFVLLLAVSASVNAFSQKENSKPMFTLCGKSGDCTMTWDEFKACKKELLPVEKNVSVVSYTVSMRVVPLEGKDSVFVDFPNTGSAFSKATLEGVDKLINEKRVVGGKIFIEAVKVSRDGKEMKTPGMVIKLK